MGNRIQAPHSQLILYPKYPEVRFSGFLKGTHDAPSKLMQSREGGRLLFLGITDKNEVIGHVVSQESDIAKEFAKNHYAGDDYGVFKLFDLVKEFKKIDAKDVLLKELIRIHELKWIKSKRLDAQNNILPCLSTNCGGYTLEAELGIAPNSLSEPDFHGWEIKQFGVKSFEKFSSAVITLMTPEPTGGFYKSNGVDEFIIKYGYADKLGRKDRLNFGGIHRVNLKCKATNLTMKLDGFDSDSGKIRNAGGAINLTDIEGEVTASWSFSSLLKHWAKKHAKAAYIPSIVSRIPEQSYCYSGEVMLGVGTSFDLFLKEMEIGSIYYDPGIKMENVSTKPKIKRRSQFRIKSGNLAGLYNDFEIHRLLAE